MLETRTRIKNLTTFYRPGHRASGKNDPFLFTIIRLSSSRPEDFSHSRLRLCFLTCLYPLLRRPPPAMPLLYWRRFLSCPLSNIMISLLFPPSIGIRNRRKKCRGSFFKHLKGGKRGGNWGKKKNSPNCYVLRSSERINHMLLFFPSWKMEKPKIASISSFLWISVKKTELKTQTFFL